MNIPEKETFGFFDELGQRTKFTEVSIMVLDRAFRCQIVSDFYFSRDCLKDILDFIISNSRRQALFDGQRTNIWLTGKTLKTSETRQLRAIAGVLRHESRTREERASPYEIWPDWLGNISSGYFGDKSFSFWIHDNLKSKIRNPSIWRNTVKK